MTALVLALSLALSLTACSPKEPSGSDSKSEQTGSASSASTSNPGTASEFDQDVEINIALHTADGIHDEAVKLFTVNIQQFQYSVFPFVPVLFGEFLAHQEYQIAYRKNHLCPHFCEGNQLRASS